MGDSNQWHLTKKKWLITCSWDTNLFIQIHNTANKEEKITWIDHSSYTQKFVSNSKLKWLVIKVEVNSFFFLYFFKKISFNLVCLISNWRFFVSREKFISIFSSIKSDKLINILKVNFIQIIIYRWHNFDENWKPMPFCCILHSLQMPLSVKWKN